MQVIGNSWDEVLDGEYQKPYFDALMKKVDEEYAEHTVYPPRDKIFSAFALPFEEVRVVILGQDPYHGEGQANGIAFAVEKGVQLPPSLVNIFKEIESDIGVRVSGSTLTGWASQGVLMLNTVLTVRAATPQSHSQIGWQAFTDTVIEKLAKREKPLVFMLWGANAQRKKPLIGKQHLVLESVHPSPLSAYRGFFGCKHFSKANDFLRKNGVAPVDWSFVDEVDKSNLSSYYEGNFRIKRV